MAGCKTSRSPGEQNIKDQGRALKVGKRFAQVRTKRSKGRHIVNRRQTDDLRPEMVIGAGAAGMAFTDALLAHSDATVTLVDRRIGPAATNVEALGLAAAPVCQTGAMRVSAMVLCTCPSSNSRAWAASTGTSASISLLLTAVTRKTNLPSSTRSRVPVSTASNISRCGS